MGTRLLNLFGILDRPAADKGATDKLTANQLKALKYIRHCIYHQQKQPTVRGITASIERRSPRSGFKMLQTLLAPGFIYRDQQGSVVIKKDLFG